MLLFLLKIALMPYLDELTAVPAGWPLETVLDAFVHSAWYDPWWDPAPADAQRAREALAARLVELWAARPAEAAAWRGLNEDRSQERLAELLFQHARSERSRGVVGSFSEAGLERVAWSWTPPSEWLEAHLRPRCSELAGRLAAAEAEAEETARKRQKVEEKGQEEKQLREEKRQLGERLEAAEAELHSAKEVVAQQKLENASLEAAQAETQRELQAAKHQCDLLTERLVAAEATLADKARELQAAQDEGVAQKDWCEQLARRLEASEASRKRCDLQRLQTDCDKQQEHCEQLVTRLTAGEAVSGKQPDLQTLLENAALKERGDLLGLQLAKAEEKLGHVLVEKGACEERCRQLERELRLAEVKEPNRLKGGVSVQSPLTSHGPGLCEAASGSNLAEQMGYTLVQTEGEGNAGDGTSSGFSVQPGCFMLDAVFQCRSSIMDFYLAGKDLRKGSQVVAGDGKSTLEVVDISKGRAAEVVSLEAGAATLQVTPDHPVQVPDKKGEVAEILYQAAGKLAAGDLVVLDSGEPAALTGIHTEPSACEVLKVVFEPDLPVAVFSLPPCILSKGQSKKPTRRSGMCRRGQVDQTADGGASIPDTAAGEYMD